MKIRKINELSIANHAYVLPLTYIPTPPKTLFIAGSVPTERRPTVAIIGSRKPTPYGIEITHRLAFDLAKRGVVIVSGLAFGIDATAHKAALEAGGTTIAVLAGGLERIYPASHKGLADAIIKQGGALISEQELGAEVRRYHFLARNRLVSGLADAIIVTEATEKSGTLSTVAHALEQNKEVFAVPGLVTSLLSAGPHRLLKQGAHIATTADDILEVIAPNLLTSSQSQLVFGDTPLEVEIIRAIQSGISDTDALQQSCSAEPGEFLRTLTMMELKGTLWSHSPGRWSLGS